MRKMSKKGHVESNFDKEEKEIEFCFGYFDIQGTSCSFAMYNFIARRKFVNCA